MCHYQQDQSPQHFQTYSIFLYSQGKLSSETDSMAQLSTPDISFSLKNVILQIGKAINCHHNVKSRLIDLATQFAPYDYFHFYIDGSVKQIGSQYCKSGFGWIQVSHPAPQCTFHGSTVFFLHPTKAKPWVF
ncbi:hypothetical protein RIR_jg39323.t1 [Rhizophagus irregularis DAOM 181602=DAOM 197198]|nr:hypothetical protein RIR_jg39323.t1 [Rhizophagus irregularis DAOM 181602=DAOM 197198]